MGRKCPHRWRKIVEDRSVCEDCLCILQPSTGLTWNNGFRPDREILVYAIHLKGIRGLTNFESVALHACGTKTPPAWLRLRQQQVTLDSLIAISVSETNNNPTRMVDTIDKRMEIFLKTLAEVEKQNVQITRSDSVSETL